MKIDYVKNAITLTAAEMKKAEIYGSDMYNNLRDARHDFPGFKISVVKTKRSADIKGLDVDTMKHYIEENDGADSELMKEFYELRGLAANGEKKPYAAVASYGELKQWFLENHAELLNLRDGIDKIMEKTRKKQEKRLAA